MVNPSPQEMANVLMDELWLLSLSLLSVLEEECWDEIPVLLHRRHEVLSALEALRPEPDWVPKLERILEADERCQRLLNGLRKELLAELGEELRQRHCGERYQTPDSEHGLFLEQDG